MPVPVKLILGLMTVWGVVYAFIALSGGDYALVPGPGSGRTEVPRSRASSSTCTR